MEVYLIRVALFHADDQTGKHDEANIGGVFFCANASVNETYVMPSLSSRTEIR